MVENRKPNAADAGKTGRAAFSREVSGNRMRIVDAAADLAAERGMAALTARSVARAAGVSVGYLYKLFPAKSDIVVAAATRFFERAFYADFCHIDPGESYVAYCRRLFARAVAVLDDFRARWLVDREDLPQSDLVAARMRESQTIAHAKRGLKAVLECDARVRWDCLPADVDAEAVVAFTARSAMSALRAGERDCPFLFYLLEKGLYGCEDDASPRADTGVAGADAADRSGDSARR